MRILISKLPSFKGKQRLLIWLDSIFGATCLRARNNINIEGFYSSIQDAAFLRLVPENGALEQSVKNLPQGGVFVDIGANCGYYSALAAGVLGPGGLVLSIEPSLREYRRLIFAYDKNPRQCDWVLCNVAAGDSNVPVCLSIDAVHTGVNHITTESGSGSQLTMVSMVDDLIFSAKLSGRIIDLVKIDVEGYEYNVLLGMKRLLVDKKIKKLNIEIADKFLKRAGSSKMELYGFMDQVGYAPTIRSEAWQYDEVFIIKN